MPSRNIDKYLSGENLWGDDFSFDEIKEWFEDEKEAYTSIYLSGVNDKVYPYHELNKYHSFHFLPTGVKYRALGIGAATGDEFVPIIDMLRDITIIEPSCRYDDRNNIHGVKSRWIKPNILGELPFSDQSFDLITCFGTLHHIPNVSFVIKEMVRVLRPNGFILIREPMISMGDWRKPRHGLTNRERGISRLFFRKVFSNMAVSILHESFSSFPPIDNLRSKLDLEYKRWFVVMDAQLSRLFVWNNKYHRQTFFEKIAARNVHFVIKK